MSASCVCVFSVKMMTMSLISVVDVMSDVRVVKNYAAAAFTFWKLLRIAHTPARITHMIKNGTREEKNTGNYFAFALHCNFSFSLHLKRQMNFELLEGNKLTRRKYVSSARERREINASR
jgi:hypothetical protein